MKQHELVKHYYGQVLQSTADLKTNACCTATAMPAHVKAVLELIHEEVQARYYGCGLVVPEALEGLRVLDLGCGSGRDTFLLSKLVGKQGFVVGIDMTPEQINLARRHVAYHTRQFGYDRPNVDFLDGTIERLEEAGLEPETFDLVVSNCVINLVPDKRAVLEQVYRLLKTGGEFYFSDVYADRRIPPSLTADPVLYGECLSGALYWNDFVTLAKACGFTDPRLVADTPVTLHDAAHADQLGNIRFYSATYRLFKLEGLEPACEDYGQAVIYRGTLRDHPHRFVLDKHHVIETGRVFPVCGNTCRMLKESRFRPYFDFLGDGRNHYGIFGGCGTALPFGEADDPEAATSGCC
jgi:SAM-dependent methyltransferase